MHHPTSTGGPSESAITEHVGAVRMPVAPPPTARAVEQEMTAEFTRTFLMKEFDALKTEIGEVRREIWSIERLAVGASGAVWAWLATNKPEFGAVWFVPVLFAVLGGMRCSALSRSIQSAGEYLRLNESRVTNYEGWETFKQRSGGAGIVRSQEVFWWTLFLITIVAGCLGFAGHLAIV